MTEPVKCEGCGFSSPPTIKVIYMAIPMRFCEYCHSVAGWWSWAMEFIPFNGKLYVYEGSYFKALIGWWRNDEDPT